MTLSPTFARPGAPLDHHPRHHSSRRLGAFAVALTFAVGLSSGVTAMAGTASEPDVVPAVQTLAVADTSNPIVATRDDITVEWQPPVQYPVGNTIISSHYGPRAAPCAGCSTLHKGVDWTPGYGAAVGAMADGVVTEIGSPHSTLGVNLTVTHDIDGVRVDSLYAHLQFGSIPVSVGDTVRVGDLVGLVGSTGQSTGAHLHFELMVNGSHVNPVSWLATHVRDEPLTAVELAAPEISYAELEGDGRQD